MKFTENQPIYLQIAEALCERILRKEWQDGERIPSVRDLAVELEVNPNTVQRTYTTLQERGIIENQRGIGYFITKGGYRQTLEMKKSDFRQTTCPGLFKTMELLGISMKELEAIFKDSTDGKRSSISRSKE